VGAVGRATRRAGAALISAGIVLFIGASAGPVGASNGHNASPNGQANGFANGHANGHANANEQSSADQLSANDPGPYNGDPDGSPSGNGNGDGNATGQPCAGCVGNADDKNPPGQLPGPQDNNNGYECDGNSGIAKTNPAHTGCTSTTTAPPTTTTKPPTTTTTAAPTTTTAAPTTTTAAPTTTAAVLGVTVTQPPTTAGVKVLGEQLARTGSDLRPLLRTAALALVLGGFCLLAGRRTLVQRSGHAG